MSDKIAAISFATEMLLNIVGLVEYLKSSMSYKCKPSGHSTLLHKGAVTTSMISSISAGIAIFTDAISYRQFWQWDP
jgi:hypothetical protein